MGVWLAKEGIIYLNIFLLILNFKLVDSLLNISRNQFIITRDITYIRM